MQQQRLLESQKRSAGAAGSTGGAGEDGGATLTPPGSPLSPSGNVAAPSSACQPLSLIVHKPVNNAGKLWNKP